MKNPIKTRKDNDNNQHFESLLCRGDIPVFPCCMAAGCSPLKMVEKNIECCFAL